MDFVSGLYFGDVDPSKGDLDFESGTQLQGCQFQSVFIYYVIAEGKLSY